MESQPGVGQGPLYPDEIATYPNSSAAMVSFTGFTAGQP